MVSDSHVLLPSSVNVGGYIQAVLDRNLAENISRVLYPNDNVSKHTTDPQLKWIGLVHSEKHIWSITVRNHPSDKTLNQGPDPLWLLKIPRHFS